MKKFILPVAATILVAWFFRWDITPVARGDGLGVAYMVNRWTGSVYMLHGVNRIEVTQGK